MRNTSRLIASAVGVVLLSVTASAQQVQGGSPLVGRIASLAAGSIVGLVQDERGGAVAGAFVSAVGSNSVFTITDRRGHFELRPLAPGPYLVRAHLGGFIALRGQIVEVRASGRAASVIALRRVTDGSPQPAPVLAAGVGAGFPQPTPAVESSDAVGSSGTEGAVVDHNHTEVTWRLRHARRGVLKDATLADGFIEGDGPDARPVFGPPGLFSRAAESPVRFALGRFASAPFSGQLHLLTAGSFDAPQQLFSADGFSRSIAHVSLTAPLGQQADWTVRGALAQGDGDVSSWVAAAAYATRGRARHRYEFGLSYGTQQFGTGSLLLRGATTSSSRSAGAVYGFDTFAVSPAISVTYGARVARYDYLGESALVSPRLGLTMSPSAHVRINAAMSRRATAPGAEQFVLPADSALWLPPQRTFSPLMRDRKLAAERTTHIELGVERDIPGATLSLRTFHQRVDDQVATIFGIDERDSSTGRLGHYLVANIGDATTSGWSAGLQTSPTQRVRGSIKYAQSRARWTGGDDLAYVILFAPATTRIESGHVHDVETTVEAEVPETSTRVLVLFQVSNAFAAAIDRLALDSRFDVQVRQSLPFMDFSNARWEMLLAVRNIFREAASDSSMYDELLVVRPPKRIVGGLTLRF